jgi:RNA polymerase sigma-70 factor (ECF subfamily)
MADATATDFDALVRPHRTELRAYCYRMLGSLADAEDALQETLLAAWRGLAGFEGRGSFRGWLYRVATHACYRVAEARPTRTVPYDAGPPARGVELDAMVEGPLWLEPYVDPPGERLERRESVELAFVAALQHLPATQRAALLLAEVLGFSAAEVAGLCDTSVASVNSALQRARATLAARVPSPSQQSTRRAHGDAAERALCERFVAAWAAQDVGALVALLTEDVQFAMAPFPTWFDGRDQVARFFAEREFATPWLLVPMEASGQLAFACYQGPAFRLGALNVITLRGGAICRTIGFLDPAVHALFSLDAQLDR